MSRFSGKCDLFDNIMMEKDGASELECFNIFKKRTGGQIYQHHKVTVSEYNQEYVKQYCPGFDFKTNTRTVPDKRSKTGYREEKSNIYLYYGKEYTLSALNKKGVYLTVPIKFDSIFDLIPYYPYVIACGSSGPDSEFIVVADDPHPVDRFKESLSIGGKLEFPTYYNKELQNHYQEVCAMLNTNRTKDLQDLMEKHSVPNVDYLENCIIKHDQCGELLEKYNINSIKELESLIIKGGSQQ